MDVRVARNAFGRQVDSFEADIPLQLPDEGATQVHGVFIRAPYVTKAEDGVDVLGMFRDRIVAGKIVRPFFAAIR